MPHLVVSISGHGFGHVAQTAPVLNRLYERMPQLRLTVRSVVPLAHLRSRIHAPFDHLVSEGDIGMVMSSAIDVLVDESRATYRRFHANWNKLVEDEVRLLRALGADLVLSNVGYLPLAGAQHAGIASAALCSLNWADIYRHYCGNDEIAAQMTDAYAKADAFLRIEPGMAMADVPNLIPIPPIAFAGKNRRDELNHRLNLSNAEKLVLVSLGGIASRLPMENWPRIDGMRWLVQPDWRVSHPDAITIESLPLNFSDLLASSDALLCKPGYGSFVEAACSGIPVLYVSRPDWPESPCLGAWLRQYGLCREITREQMENGRFANDLAGLWSATHPVPPLPGGIDEATNWLLRQF
jgi:UDP:flavonoid glycosyltransferase YjiC (YdhE family)